MPLEASLEFALSNVRAHCLVPMTDFLLYQIRHNKLQYHMASLELVQPHLLIHLF